MFSDHDLTFHIAEHASSHSSRPVAPVAVAQVVPVPVVSLPVVPIAAAPVDLLTAPSPPAKKRGRPRKVDVALAKQAAREAAEANAPPKPAVAPRNDAADAAEILATMTYSGDSYQEDSNPADPVASSASAASAAAAASAARTSGRKSAAPEPFEPYSGRGRSVIPLSTQYRVSGPSQMHGGDGSAPKAKRAKSDTDGDTESK